jgi:hypothetical protein
MCKKNTLTIFLSILIYFLALPKFFFQYDEIKRK